MVLNYTPKINPNALKIILSMNKNCQGCLLGDKDCLLRSICINITDEDMQMLQLAEDKGINIYELMDNCADSNMFRDCLIAELEKVG